MSRNYSKSVRVTLREKSIQFGKKISLYLDFYPSVLNPMDGKQTRRFSLGIYLYANPSNKAQRSENKTKLAFAEHQRANIEIAILNNDFSFFGDFAPKVGLLDFMQKNCNMLSHKTMLLHLEQYLTQEKKTDINICDVTLKLCEGFKQYVLNAVSQNSAASYMISFKSLLRLASKENPLSINVMDIPNIRKLDTNRDFLSIEELKLLIRTECRNVEIKNACLFSAFTGLRISDVVNLTWGNIQKNDNQFVLNFRQQKTKAFENIPIGDLPMSYCGERQNDNQKVFEGVLLKNSTQTMIIKLWVALAGIKKNITFHCFRHTYATLLLNQGVDIYTVSKMLGHRSVKTTQIYAKVVDSTKRNAANRIDDAMK